MKRLAIVLLAFAGLGACSHAPDLPKVDLAVFSSKPKAAAKSSEQSRPDAIASADLKSRNDVGLAIDLLSAGNEKEALKTLTAILKANPESATALLLMKQIKTEPRKLLGETSQDYVVQPGDSMSTIADRFLGNPLMFYALSRYNGIAAPNSLAASRILKIPSSAAARASSPIAATMTVVTKPNLPVVDASTGAAADGMRLRALESLNKGDVSNAVALLTEARRIDPADEAIERDLDRALRIQKSLSDG